MRFFEDTKTRRKVLYRWVLYDASINARLPPGNAI
jgi:hypothetical protein